MSSGSDSYWKNKRLNADAMSKRVGSIYKISKGSHSGEIATLVKLDDVFFLELVHSKEKLEILDEEQLLRVASYMAKDIYEYSK